MDAAEFRRRYEACEDLEHVELIEGVVYMPSPIRAAGHAEEQGWGVTWLSYYRSLHPDDVVILGPGTVWLDDKNAPEPDAMLVRRRPDMYTVDGYLAYVPDLIIEIANSSRSRDLHQKKRAYERSGVLEYIVWRTQDREIDWFQLRDGRYVPRDPDAEGIIESEIFPGLRLSISAMLARDAAAIAAPVR
jgi:Uma2 family endonuclease